MEESHELKRVLKKSLKIGGCAGNSKSEEGQAFVHANCNSSERKRPYCRVLYLVLFDTSLESEFGTWYIFKILNKNKSHFWMGLLQWKK
jgi:hypothetical protein